MLILFQVSAQFSVIHHLLHLLATVICISKQRLYRSLALVSNFIIFRPLLNPVARGLTSGSAKTAQRHLRNAGEYVVKRLRLTLLGARRRRR